MAAALPLLKPPGGHLATVRLSGPLSVVAGPVRARARARSLDGSRGSTPVSRSEEWESVSCCSSSASSLVVAAAAAAAAAGSALVWPDASSAFETVTTFAGPEPSNALSLPTWVIHLASVVEWVTAMALVWKYGETEGRSAWKGLAWGMVPLLGGALCACTWHFFYNAESLEVLVVLQAFLTVVGNFTLWAAAYRIWQSSQEIQS